MFENPTKLKTISNIFTKGKLDYYKLDLICVSLLDLKNKNKYGATGQIELPAYSLPMSYSTPELLRLVKIIISQINPHLIYFY